MRSFVISTDAGSTRVWQFFLLLGFLAATVAVWREPTYTRPEQLVVLSLACLAAALVAVALHRTLLPLVSPERILGDARRARRARVALEREKRLVLRSIKELEFDRAMGKVADADFDEMVGRLRDRAVGLMQRLEQANLGLRERIARDLAARPVTPVTAVPSFVPSAGVSCRACDGANDADASFCKHCGARL
jgi:hypothetical protein